MFFFEYLGALTNHYRYHTLTTLGLAAVLAMLAFVSVTTSQAPNSVIPLKSDLIWHTLTSQRVETNRVESARTGGNPKPKVTSILETGQLGKHYKYAQYVRVMKSIVRIKIKQEAISTAIFINGYENLKDVHWLEDSGRESGILLSEFLWQIHQQDLHRNLNFVEVDGIRKKVVGIFQGANNHSHYDPNIILPLDALSQNEPQDELKETPSLHPNEVLLVGLEKNIAKAEAEKQINIVTDSLGRKNIRYGLVEGIYQSTFDLVVRQNLSAFSATHLPLIIVCAIFLVIAYSQKLSNDILRDRTLVFTLGHKSGLELRFLLNFLVYFFGIIFLSSFSFGVITQGVFTFNSTLVMELPVFSNLIDFSLSYLPFLAGVSALLSVIMTVILLAYWLMSKGEASDTLTNDTLRNAQLRFAFSITFISLFCTYCFILLLNSADAVNKLFDWVDASETENIVVLELENSSKTIENFGSVIYGQSIDKLMSELEQQKANGKIEKFSLSSMFPHFPGGSYNSFRITDGTSVITYLNNIAGDYFSLHGHEPRLDKAVNGISDNISHMANKQLHEYLQDGERKYYLIKELVFMDINGNQKTEKNNIHIIKPVPEMPYQGSFSDANYLLYGKVRHSLDVDYIGLKFPQSASVSVIEAVKSALPTDLKLKKLHNYSEIVQEETYSYIFKFASILIIFLACLVILFLIVKYSVVTLFLYIEESVVTLHYIGAKFSYLMRYTVGKIAPAFLVVLIIGGLMSLLYRENHLISLYAPVFLLVVACCVTIAIFASYFLVRIASSEGDK